MNQDEYKCEKCNDIWGFIPEDYENKEDYPTIYPLCYMPITEMIKDVYSEEGLIEVIKRIWIRIFN